MNQKQIDEWVCKAAKELNCKIGGGCQCSFDHLVKDEIDDKCFREFNHRLLIQFFIKLFHSAIELGRELENEEAAETAYKQCCKTWYSDAEGVKEAIRDRRKKVNDK